MEVENEKVKLCLGLIVVVALAPSGCFNSRLLSTTLQVLSPILTAIRWKGVLVAADTDPAVSVETDVPKGSSL